MEFLSKARITAPRDKVWRFLCDIWSLSHCVPGVEQVKMIDSLNCKGEMRIKVGPIGLRFEGDFKVEEIDESSGILRMRIEGSDKRMGGSVKTNMTMKLTAISEEDTELSVVTEAAILGKLGQFGLPLMRKKADSIMSEFAKNVSQQVMNMPDLSIDKTEEGEEGASSEETESNKVRIGELITRDGTKLHYTLQGVNHTELNRIVFIHSLALNEEVWKSVVERFSSMATILTYDCRGHGASSKTPGPYSLELFAADLADLFDGIGWQSAIIAGCSMGGSVAQTFAITYPDRTQGLYLVDTSAWYGADAPEKWEQRASQAERDGLKSLVDFQVTRWFSDGFREQFPEVSSRFTKVFLDNKMECYAAACRMLGGYDLREKITGIKVPCAVVVGEEDYATPMEMGLVIHKAIAGSTFDVLPSTRHLSPTERPDEIVKILKELINRVFVTQEEVQCE